MTLKLFPCPSRKRKGKRGTTRDNEESSSDSDMSDDVGLGKVSDETVLFENKDAQNGGALEIEHADKEYNFPKKLKSKNTMSKDEHTKGTRKNPYAD
ncbi:hypothetical protein SUGI_0958800 [Cryptomeria japonica]|nr:hypothetical protein SUGI_0958800 [Cryptomeria japonica]